MDIPFCNAVEPDWEVVKRKIQASLSSGRMSNFGPLYQEFSDALHSYLGVPKTKEVVITSSGHTALMAAYSCIAKAVAIPNYTFESTRCAATLQHIPTTITDVYKDTGAIDVSKADSSVFDTIVVVTPLSSVPDLDEYSKYCRDKNKKLIIDGAASFGMPGIYGYGDAYCLSFHATKSFPVGECGVVICDKSEAKRIKRYLTFGLDENKVASSIGINGKVSEYTCAIGLALLEKIDEHLFCRSRNAKILQPTSKDNYRTLDFFSREKKIYQSFPIYTPRAKEVAEVLEQNGIATLKYYNPIHKNKDYPVSNKLFEENICLPVHSGVSEKDAINIRKIITDVVN